MLDYDFIDAPYYRTERQYTINVPMMAQARSQIPSTG